MSRKTFIQISVFVLFVLAFLGTPFIVQAGGVCGGVYIVEQGETLEKIAATCGTTVAAITNANPGISGSVYPGQRLTVPGNSYVVPSTPIPSPIPGTTYNGTYIVQAGDTFAGIASRFGVKGYDLWAANPSIVDVNFLYAGQVIYVPTSYVPASSVNAVIVQTTATEDSPSSLSYSTVPFGTQNAKVKLISKTKSDIYISLQGVTNDGYTAINEYSVNRSMAVRVPTGRYTYVAWVGGQKFIGYFRLNSDRYITFYDKSVVVE